MKVLQGDLIQMLEANRFDAIVHGCNCFCTMGAGIAKQIKERFPQAYEADLRTVSGDRKKLGTYTVAPVHVEGKIAYVINAYTQYDWRGKGRKADYEAIRMAFIGIRRDFGDARIGYPMIGAGLARGDWGQISQIIDQQLAGLDHSLVILN